MKTKRCDVAIIGSGFGGAGCAYALSRAGLDVIVIERGGYVARDDEDWDPKEILIDKRYKSDVAMEIDQREGKAPSLDYPNEVVGGNSIFYGGAALRMRERDFDTWPLSYADFEPYYDAAEALQEVRGQAGADPFEPPRNVEYPRPPNALTPAAARIASAARALEMKPFRIPIAIDFEGAGAREACISCFTCDGFPCKLGAKNDTQVILERADAGHLEILAQTVAGRLQEEDGRIAKLCCQPRGGGEPLEIEAETFIVAGGAVQSPAILLRSGLQRFDRSKLIGRNLMRHCNGMVGGVFPFRVNPEGKNHKQICLSDLYEDRREEHGRAVGVIQDMCMPPKDAVRYLAPDGFRTAAATFSSFIQALICIAEDRPRRVNQVTLGDERDVYGLERLRIIHRYAKEDYERRALLVGRARELLREAGAVITKLREVDSFSHAVGSVRFGEDSEAAPLDLHCRLHGLSNLYVVDGSFFPSSAGVNPSLTILANALRVSEQIVSTL
ncbi:MAG: GMC family oxidoreductase [Deltaproteobacteria bacterium]|nr:GMC family oxidoreductase [Deltaproteobacteria bacterium]